MSICPNLIMTAQFAQYKAFYVTVLKQFVDTSCAFPLFWGARAASLTFSLEIRMATRPRTHAPTFLDLENKYISLPHESERYSFLASSCWFRMPFSSASR